MPSARFLFAAVPTPRYLGPQGYELCPSGECPLPLCLISASYLLFVQSRAMGWKGMVLTGQIKMGSGGGCEKKVRSLKIFA